MILETFNPPGLYFGINICSQKLIKHLEDEHRSFNSNIKIKFYFVPLSYFFKDNFYYVILEMKVYYKRSS